MRSGLYRLLATVYLGEMDAQTLAVLRHYEGFAAAIGGETGPDLLTHLRAEYARVFLLNVYPYESAYVDKTAMLNTAATQAVVDVYRALAFAPDPARRAGALDHIGYELELMGELTAREGTLVARGDVAAAMQTRASQRAFLEEHLASWGPIFATSASRDARARLYRELGSFTAEFLLADLDALTREAKSPLPPGDERRVSGRPYSLPPGGGGRGRAESRASRKRGGLASALPERVVTATEPGGFSAESDLRTLARGFTTPARAGFHVSREELFRLAGRLQLPLAPVERWLMLEQLFHAASRYDQLPALLAGLQEMAEQARSTYTGWERCYPGAAAAIRPWRERASRTVALLRDMRHAAGA